MRQRLSVSLKMHLISFKFDSELRKDCWYYMLFIVLYTLVLMWHFFLSNFLGDNILVVITPSLSPFLSQPFS